jgi:hypothetical protein
VCIVGDFAQLQPVGGGLSMKTFAERLRHIRLLQHEYARSKDPELLDFLRYVRTRQPSRPTLAAFFRGRAMPRTFASAVSFCEREAGDDPFTWLTVTNNGSREVNLAFVAARYGITDAQLEEYGIPGDHKAGGSRLIIRPGMRIRLTRNLDKDKGFVNGALGTVDLLLDPRGCVFTFRLQSGAMLLVHPVFSGGHHFLPCAYGYAMTIRRAQGATLGRVVLYFDHTYPAERGYAYVGASRVRAASGLYYFGTMRQSDWLPVGGDPETEHTIRGVDSVDDSDEEEDPSDDEGGGLLDAISRRKASRSVVLAGDSESDAGSGGGGHSTQSEDGMDAMLRDVQQGDGESDLEEDIEEEDDFESSIDKLYVKARVHSDNGVEEDMALLLDMGSGILGPCASWVPVGFHYRMEQMAAAGLIPITSLADRGAPGFELSIMEVLSS